MMPRSLELAWQAALDANIAFDRLRETESQLRILREAGNLGLQGVSIANEAFEELDDRMIHARNEFEALTSMAAPSMLAEDSPFVVPSIISSEAATEEKPESESWFSPERIVLSGPGVETLTEKDFAALAANLAAKDIMATRIGKISLYEAGDMSFNFQAAARTLSEMQAFADRRRYSKGTAAAAFNVVRREAEAIPVATLADYEATVTDELPGHLILVEPAESYLNKSMRGIDIRTLHQAVLGWLKDGTNDIRNFGPGLLSFLADYLNHALPGIEPLPVALPPEKRKLRLPPNQ